MRNHKGQMILDTTLHIFRICLVFLVCCTRSSYAVKWSIQTDPVVFGKDVELMCNFSVKNQNCVKCTKRWYGGHDIELLAFDGITSDSSKYKSEIWSNGFSLVIKNFSQIDVNVPYVCTYGFDSQRKMLSMNDNFEYQPSDTTMRARHNIDHDAILHVYVDFKVVHPTPNCSIFLNQLDLTEELGMEITKHDLFEQVSYQLKYQLRNKMCSDVLHMVCVVGTRSIEVINTHIDHNCHESKIPVSYVIIGVCILSVIVLAACLTPLLAYKIKDNMCVRQLAA